jgi:hypothetical protein
VSRPTGFHRRPLAGRVGDWRAGLGRSLCSPLTRSFVCECHISYRPCHVSSLRCVERNVPFSSITLSCVLRLKAYGTYHAGAAFRVGR